MAATPLQLLLMIHDTLQLWLLSLREPYEADQATEGAFSAQALGGNFSTVSSETSMTNFYLSLFFVPPACPTIKPPDYSQFGEFGEGGFFLEHESAIFLSFQHLE